MARDFDGDRYLKVRSGWYYYYRHIPRSVQAFYEGRTIRIALGTKSLEVARMRRDELVQADNAYWSQLKLAVDLEKAGEKLDTTHARKRYEVAKAHAMAAGFAYRPLSQLAETSQLEDIVRRLLSVERAATSDGRLVPAAIDSLLGGVEPPKVSVSEAMEIYQTKIAPPRLIKKSPEQKRLWKATLDRSLRYFVDAIGDLAMTDIAREHGQAYYEFWNGEITPEDPDTKPKSPKTAARHFGDMRNLYTEYFKYMGEEDRPNPFRNLGFKDRRANGRRKVASFEDKWVREKILVPGWFEDLTDEIFLVPMIILETGCRPGEVINLRPEDIRIDAKIPHLVIPDRDDREVKTETSVRRIPLVGVSLEAARRASDGFPKYHDKSNGFSAAANAAFRRKKLFPTQDHVIYSFRHSFEDRMKEAGIDYELRLLLMGHKNERPEYGTGGSLEYQRKELLKIAHPVPKGFFAAFDVSREA